MGQRQDRGEDSHRLLRPALLELLPARRGGVVGAGAVAEGEALALLQRDLLERLVVAGDGGVEDALPHVRDGLRQLLLGQAQPQAGRRALDSWLGGLGRGGRLGLDRLGLGDRHRLRRRRGGVVGLAAAGGEHEDEHEREQDSHAASF